MISMMIAYNAIKRVPGNLIAPAKKLLPILSAGRSKILSLYNVGMRDVNKIAKAAGLSYSGTIHSLRWLRAEGYIEIAPQGNMALIIAKEKNKLLCLDVLKTGPKETKDLCESLKVSRNTLYQYLRELTATNEVNYQPGKKVRLIKLVA